ncbi:hypothetical protein NECAME_15090 [Necator americanus]|uniref:Uncharacterized protein n=1 Tax=Necator americanus TaxID=51031 RepID=W2SLQ1_NECAM|nr:hypothetical protein NECAME_15090 [Necator americanus]ETN69766.1 hypothetical protein NECAME_15090 [Necator americanus]
MSEATSVPRSKEKGGIISSEEKVDRQVLWDRLDEWSDRNISQVFKQAQPGDEIEVSIVVDFRNAPSTNFRKWSSVSLSSEFLQYRYVAVEKRNR